MSLCFCQPNGRHLAVFSLCYVCLFLSTKRSSSGRLSVFAVSVCFCQPHGRHLAVFLCLCCVCLFLSTKRSSSGCLSVSLLCLSVSVNQTVVIRLSFCVFAVSVCFCQPNGRHQAVFLCLCCVCLFLSTKRSSSGCLSVSLLCLSVSVSPTAVTAVRSHTSSGSLSESVCVNQIAITAV